MKKAFLTSIAVLFLATGMVTARADEQDNEQDITPAICFTLNEKSSPRKIDKIFKICGDLSDCMDWEGGCEPLERDRLAHVKAGRLICYSKDECEEPVLRSQYLIVPRLRLMWARRRLMIGALIGVGLSRG